jgi:hypothetical protein
MKAEDFSETQIVIYKTTRYHVPEDNIRHIHGCDNHESRNLNAISTLIALLFLYWCLSMWSDIRSHVY